MLRKTFLVLFLSLTVGISSVSATEETIGYLFRDKIKNNTPVKVYIADIINQSGQSQIAPEAFKKSLEQSLFKRRSIKFEIVNNRAESDIQISAIIKNYRYLERGPLKPTPSIQTTFLDAMATSSGNYVDISVEYSVTDTKNNKLIWNKKLTEYLKKKMTLEESIPLIYDVTTRAFIWKCFGKANLRETRI